MRLMTLLVFCGVCLNGCAYQVLPGAAPAVNVYSAFDDKVPGHFVLVIDDSVRSVRREVRPSSFECGAHTYPLAVGEALAISVKNTMDAVVERATETAAIPTNETMVKDKLKAAVIVRLDDFSPRLSCASGFWTASCTATAEIVLGVSVRGPSGLLFATGAAGSKTVDGSAGNACAGGAAVLADAVSRAMRDAMERLAERMANAPKLRGAGQ